MTDYQVGMSIRIPGARIPKNTRSWVVHYPKSFPK